MTSQDLYPLVHRARTDPWFLGFHLARYAEQQGIDETELAGRLGCELERLPNLMLCRCPGPTESQYAHKLREIAEYVPCDLDSLMAVLNGE